jgi:dihydroxyacetone kinase-like predicted kinase
MDILTQHLKERRKISRWVTSEQLEVAKEYIADPATFIRTIDVTINGKAIKVGDYIAISNGEIVAVEKDAEAAACAMLDGVDMDEYEIITLFVGKNVSEEKRAELTEALEDKYPECEVVVYEGGQDVYDYLVAIE